MTRIKVSGLVRPEDGALAASLGIDLVACIFNPGSPRYVTIEQAWTIRRALGGTVRLVGVFVDAPPPLVQRIADQCRLDYVQLFGAESRSVVESMRTHAFKAVTVATAEESETALRTHGIRRGGHPLDPALQLHCTGALDTAQIVLPAAARRTGVIVSAPGLTTETVGGVVEGLSPWAVDVWEAVEAQPGQVDPGRLEAFVGAVRAADAGRPAGV